MPERQQTRNAIEFDDIQALVRFGHGQLPDSRLVLLQIRNRHHAGTWLQNSSFTSATIQNPLPESAMQIAFTPAGLKALGVPDVVLEQFSDEFLSGMSGSQSRSRRLGDVEDNAPDKWTWGHRDAESIHLLLMIYTSEKELKGHLTRLQNPEFQRAFETLHTLPDGTLTPEEPFGFLDGISQPAIDWQQNQRTDTHARNGYSNLVAPGEIILGYHNEYGQLTRSPTIDTSMSDDAEELSHTQSLSNNGDLGKNGTYLVFRQLQQDVNGFQHFLYQQTAGNADKARQLAARMVGRQPNGDPLATPGVRKISGIPSTHQQNNFDYDADPDGLQCPVGAHVRRSNPRTGDLPPRDDTRLSRLWRRLGFKRQHEYEDLVASSRFHRILRRGRPYGPSVSTAQTSPATGSVNDINTPERGLHFICLTANIVRQFEFVQGAWAISSSFAGTREQQDPLLGHRQASDSGSRTDLFMMAEANGAQEKIASLPQFVTVRGGGYFFLPGLRAIRYLGELAAKESQL